MAGQGHKRWLSVAGLWALTVGGSACDRNSQTQANIESEQDRARGAMMPAVQDWAAKPRAGVLVHKAAAGYAQGSAEDFKLALPLDWKDPNSKTVGFDQAEMERFVVRLPSGSMDSIALAGDKTRGTLSYRYPESGTMMSSMCVRSPKGSDKKVHYCLKRVHTVGQGPAHASSSSRFGDEAELRPLVAPERVVPGSDLPVMVYLDGERARGVTVYAFGPGGRTLSAVTGNAGVADLRIDALGAWTVRAASEISGVQMVAELEFSNEVGGRY